MSENGPSEVLIRLYHTSECLLTLLKKRDAHGAENSRAEVLRDVLAGPYDSVVTSLLLVFGCIGTDLCKKIRVLQHFSKSIRLSS